MTKHHAHTDGSPSPMRNMSSREPSHTGGGAGGEHTHPAIENLRDCQRQLDMDGCEVGVSRQALDETLAILDGLLEALIKLDALHTHFREATSGNQADAYYTFIKGEDATWRAVSAALSKASPPDHGDIGDA